MNRAENCNPGLFWLVKEGRYHDAPLGDCLCVPLPALSLQDSAFSLDPLMLEGRRPHWRVPVRSVVFLARSPAEISAIQAAFGLGIGPAFHGEDWADFSFTFEQDSMSFHGIVFWRSNGLRRSPHPDGLGPILQGRDLRQSGLIAWSQPLLLAQDRQSLRTGLRQIRQDVRVHGQAIVDFQQAAAEKLSKRFSV